MVGDGCYPNDKSTQGPIGLDKFKSDLHIEMAARGSVSGTLSEYTLLKDFSHENH
jgi:hypothetical protein